MIRKNRFMPCMKRFLLGTCEKLSILIQYSYSHPYSFSFLFLIQAKFGGQAKERRERDIPGHRYVADFAGSFSDPPTSSRWCM
jgi:hypothetical protein